MRNCLRYSSFCFLRDRFGPCWRSVEFVTEEWFGECDCSKDAWDGGDETKGAIDKGPTRFDEVEVVLMMLEALSEVVDGVGCSALEVLFVMLLIVAAAAADALAEAAAAAEIPWPEEGLATWWLWTEGTGDVEEPGARWVLEDDTSRAGIWL